MTKPAGINPAWFSLALSVLVNVCVLTYQHGRLTQRVDDLGDEVRKLEAALKTSAQQSQPCDSKPHTKGHRVANMRGINKIRTDELWLPEGFGNFQALTANTLGQEITDNDGWDNDLNAVASLLGEDINTVSALDGFLSDAGFVVGALDDAVLSGIAQDHAAMVDGGDPLLDDLSGIVSNAPGQSPPPPPPGPPPPEPGGGPGGGPPPGGTGGGEGGGESGGAPAITCILFDHANSPPTTSCTIEGDKIGGGVHPPLLE